MGRNTGHTFKGLKPCWLVDYENWKYREEHGEASNVSNGLGSGKTERDIRIEEVISKPRERKGKVVVKRNTFVYYEGEIIGRLVYDKKSIIKNRRWKAYRKDVHLNGFWEAFETREKALRYLLAKEI